MKKVYIVSYASGLCGTTKVFADDEESARKAAYAAYTFNSGMEYPGHRVSDVVTHVELDPNQLMNANVSQPCVQVDYAPLTFKQVIEEQFGAQFAERVKPNY